MIRHMVAAAAACIAMLVHAQATAAQDPTPAIAVVSGMLHDSITRRPISGAAVAFVNAENPQARPHATTSDSTGRYVLRGIPYGSYLAGFFHPAMDTLGLESVPRRVVVDRPTVRADLATPSARTIAASVCSGGAVSDSTGVLIGHVRSTESRTPVSGATVVAEWRETIIDPLGLRDRTRTVTARAEEPGWFAICGLPSDAGLQARAFHGPDSSGYIDVDVPANGLRHVGFLIGGASIVGVAPGEGTSGDPTVPGTALRGRARLTGTVVDHAGRPMVGAHALVWGTKLEAITTADGAFALDGLPGGTHMLEVRAIGHAPTTATVHLAESRPASVAIALAKPVEVLSTVTVRGELVYARNLADFERRRRAGWGQFVTSNDIARRPNAKLSQLLQTVAGIRLELDRGRYLVLMQRNATTGAGRASCIPSLFVDGVNDRVRDFDAYFAEEIAGIEVYRGEMGRPFEFIDPSNPCGAIAIWTRAIPVKPRRD